MADQTKASSGGPDSRTIAHELNATGAKSDDSQHVYRSSLPPTRYCTAVDGENGRMAYRAGLLRSELERQRFRAPLI